jgi:alpha-glucosidase
MQWNAGLNAGFSEADPDSLWLPVAENYTSINVESELSDPHSHLSLYRWLLQLRRESEALQHGSYRSLESGSDDVFLYERKCENETLLIALNFSGEARPLPGITGEVLLSTCVDETQEIRLRPHEGLLIRLA